MATTPPTDPGPAGSDANEPLLDLAPGPDRSPAAVAETHISIVLFAGSRAIKMLKPVDLGFVDLTTRPRRRRECEREVALNRRFAPDVYLGVIDLVDEHGTPQDHAIVMRRLPVGRRLATLLGGPEAAAQLRAVARLMAAAHAAAERSPAAVAAASAENVARLWRDNAARMANLPAGTFDTALLEELRDLQVAYMAGRSELFERRVADGHAVDGHGDLLAEDIFCLPDGPRILDCLAFDDRLRCGDVLYDVAFLAMDTERLAGARLAEGFLHDYVEFSGEHHPASLAEFYIGYRAQVRALVSGLRAAQGDERAALAAAGFVDQAIAHLRRALPRLVLVGGTPATGKSTLAEALSNRFGWSLLGTDELRKDLAGVPHASDQAAPPGQGLYQPALTEATYAELLRRAGRLLAMGESVVADGSWVDASHRAEARRLAAASSARIVEIRCQVDEAVALDRLQARRATGGGPSDATPEVLRHLVRQMAPWDEARVVDTGAPPDEVLAAALGLLDG